MTTKPATPLPFREFAPEIDGVVEQDYRYIEGGRGYYGGSDRRAGFSITGKIDPRDAGYMVHAANAYPRLVEALRNCVHAQDVTGGPKGSTELACTEGARFLLRELGEL